MNGYYQSSHFSTGRPGLTCRVVWHGMNVEKGFNFFGGVIEVGLFMNTMLSGYYGCGTLSPPQFLSQEIRTVLGNIAPAPRFCDKGNRIFERDFLSIPGADRIIAIEFF